MFACRRIVLSVLLVPTLSLSACRGGNAEKCNEALGTTRKAIESNDFTSAQSWREYAWKQCDDRQALEALDRELIDKRNQVAAKEQEAAAKQQEKRELLKVFLSWARDHRNAADRASSAPVCDPPNPADRKKEESKDRFCTATREAGTATLQARYWAAEPAAVRFTVRLPEPTSCEELGAGAAVKTWQVPATLGRTAERFRCEFTSGPLAGMYAVGSRAVNAELYVFSPAYLEKEPALKATLEGP
ncbi:MAG: hypothetical protein DIU78_002670 [Pseudomonadota bacterium]|nr:MAG: hypothetical protein DIU78_10965 [Pseudomonadota bacterium]